MKKFPIDWEDFNNEYNCQVAVAMIGGSAVAAAATAYSANKAASAQTEAANQAAMIAQNAQNYAKGNFNTAFDYAKDIYDKTRSDLTPYRALGEQAAGDLSSRLDFLTSPIVMDQAALEQTPGYQFTKTQGLKAVQNSAAVRGLGVSGAALKGAATFATGLADQTYQTQFNLENINRTNAFNRLQTLVSGGQGAVTSGGAIGASTAGTVGSAATGASGAVNTAAGQAGSAAIGAGNAGAAAINATGGAISKFASDVGGYYAYKGLYDNSGSGTGGVNNSNFAYGPRGQRLPTSLYEEGG